MGDDRPSHRRVWLAVIACGIVIAGLALCVKVLRPGAERTPATTAVVHLLCDTARARDRGDDPTAGVVGPWRIAAAAADPQTGRLTGFRLESGRMHLVAASAQLFVDPDTDAFGFELFDVVYTRVPDPDEDTEALIHEMPHYVLGPVSYGRDIIDDGSGVPRSAAGETS
jgi:hypothetical protein